MFDSLLVKELNFKYVDRCFTYSKLSVISTNKDFESLLTRNYKLHDVKWTES